MATELRRPILLAVLLGTGGTALFWFVRLGWRAGELVNPLWWIAAVILLVGAGVQTAYVLENRVHPAVSVLVFVGWLVVISAAFYWGVCGNTYQPRHCGGG